MKPLDGRSAPDRRENTGRPEARISGKSGQGAASALDQLRRDEMAQALQKPGDAPQEPAAD